MKCPKCGSKEVAPILHGMPAWSEDLEQKLNNRELYLGGCCLTGADPDYHCFGCKKDFGTPPILLSKRGMEDYREIVTSVRFCDGGYFDGYPEIRIEKKSTGILLDVRPGFSTPDSFLQRPMAENEWKTLLDHLYGKLYLHEWKKTFLNLDILDGEQWELEIHLTNGRVRNYHGSNAFPPYWSKLKAVFRPFFVEAGIRY